jgi:hypothetical protein
VYRNSRVLKREIIQLAVNNRQPGMGYHAAGEIYESSGRRIRVTRPQPVRSRQAQALQRGGKCRSEKVGHTSSVAEAGQSRIEALHLNGVRLPAGTPEPAHHSPIVPNAQWLGYMGRTKRGTAPAGVVERSMLRKGQVDECNRGDAVAQAHFVDSFIDPTCVGLMIHETFALNCVGPKECFRDCNTTAAGGGAERRGRPRLTSRAATLPALS